MEFGPRALGGRSILADARSVKMQSYLNLATKFRESFRPSPIVLKEDAAEYFEGDPRVPYMLMVDQVKKERCLPISAEKSGKDAKDDAPLNLKDWVNTPRSDIPAVTHVDFSARIQTVDTSETPASTASSPPSGVGTGYGILVNTSFNVRSEPIVCTPEDAYRCFMRTGIDVLVLENCVLDKTEQPPWKEKHQLAGAIRPRLRPASPPWCLPARLLRMLRDVLLLGIVNRSFAMSFAILSLFIIGLTIIAAQVTAPFIYTLF